MCVVWIVLWVGTYVGVGVLCVWGLGHVAVYYVLGKHSLSIFCVGVCRCACGVGVCRCACLCGVCVFVCVCVCVCVSVHLLYESLWTCSNSMSVCHASY